MHVEHHDLAHEFPQFKDAIHRLKTEDAHFNRLFHEYQDLDKEVCRAEEGTEVLSDEALHALKIRRVHLKDELERMLIASQG